MTECRLIGKAQIRNTNNEASWKNVFDFAHHLRCQQQIVIVTRWKLSLVAGLWHANRPTKKIHKKRSLNINENPYSGRFAYYDTLKRNSQPAHHLPLRSPHAFSYQSTKHELLLRLPWPSTFLQACRGRIDGRKELKWTATPKETFAH